MSPSPSRHPKRKPGAQPGNVNALTHGFYSKALPRAQRDIYTTALGANPTDLTDEIALMRERLTALMTAQPDAFDLLRQGVGTLARLAATHYHLSGSAGDQLTDAMHNVLDDIERTLGPKGD